MKIKLLLMIISAFILSSQAMQRITLQTDDGAEFVADSDLLKTSKTLQECLDSIDYEKEKVVPVVGLAGDQFSELLGYWQLNDDAQRCRQSLQPQTKEKLAQLLNHSTYLGIDSLTQIIETALVNKLNNKQEWKLAESNEGYNEQLGLTDSALNKKVAAELLKRRWYKRKETVLASQSIDLFSKAYHTALTISPDDNIVAHSCSEIINIISLINGSDIKLLQKSKSNSSLVFNLENKNQLLSASSACQGGITLWDLEKQRSIQSFTNPGGHDTITDAIFLNNNIVATVDRLDWSDSDEDYELVLFDTRKPLPIQRLNKGKYMPFRVGSMIKKDDTTIFLSPNDWHKTVSEWDLRKDECSHTYHHQKDVGEISYNPDDQQLISVTGNGAINVWNADRNCIKTIEIKDSRIKKLKYLGNNKTMVHYCKRNLEKIKLLNLAKGNRKTLISIDSRPLDCLVYDVDSVDCCTQGEKIVMSDSKTMRNGEKVTYDVKVSLLQNMGLNKSDLTVKSAMQLLSIDKKNKKDVELAWLKEREERRLKTEAIPLPPPPSGYAETVRALQAREKK